MKAICSLVAAGMFTFSASAAHADPMSCNLSAYKRVAGLAAVSANDALTVTWDGDRGIRSCGCASASSSGTPTIQELAIRRNGGAWATLATNVTPEFRVVSGLRRMSNQQLTPLRGLGVELTPAIVDRYRWEPFWDAPLDLESPVGPRRQSAAGATASRISRACRASRRRSSARRRCIASPAAR